MSFIISSTLTSSENLQLILHSQAYPTQHPPRPPLSCIPLKIPSFLIFPISSPCQNPLPQNPYLPSPLGCFNGLLLSLSLFDFCLKLQKPNWAFSHFLQYLPSLLEPHLKIFTSFLFVSLCVQEQVEETYIMVKPDGVQRGLVSFTLICLPFLKILCHVWLLRAHGEKVFKIFTLYL